MLIIACICREIKKISGIPFTPLLLVAGIACGGYSDKMWLFGTGLDIVITMDAHGILLIFIPILVFEAAYNTDLYYFKREFWQVLILAGPGVIISALLLAFTWNYVLGYSDEFNLYGGLTFGSICSATDTVAVLALLKELGTPNYFRMLFEGENLLNDATAMVFYIVFSNMFKAKGMTAFGAVLQFLQLSIGGCFLGSAIFLIVLVWLGSITRDKILVITITVVSGFLTFFLAENVVMVSGLLSVVVLGVLMAMHAKMRMTPEAAEMVHIVISFIQFCLESILFLITGVFIGKMYIFEKNNTLQVDDYYKSLIFFVFMNLARYIMIKMLLPLINDSGCYKLGWRDVIVLSYGGVRGSLGLALALIIYRDSDYNERFRVLVLFYIAVMIVISVIFNGLTIGWVMKLINFAPVNPLTYKIKNNVLKNVIIASLKKREAISQNKFLKLAKWEEVEKLVNIKDLITKESKESKELKRIDDEKKRKQGQEMKLTSPLLRGEKEFEKVEVQEVRMRYYNIIKSTMYEKFEQDYCSIPILKSLYETCAECMEDLDKPIWLWENVSQELMSVEQVLYLLKIRRIPCIGGFTSGYFTKFFLTTYEKLSVIVMVLDEILDEKPEIPLNVQIVNMVTQELYKNKSKFEERMFYICDLFPEFISSVQNKQAAQIVLNSQKNVVQESFANGYISEEDYLRMTYGVEKAMGKLDVGSHNWSSWDINELELIEPSFSKLNKELLNRIKTSSITYEFKEEEIIYRKGDPVKGLLIILKGMVEDNLSLDARVTLGVGGILSFANIVTVDGKSMTTLRCLKDATAYLVPKDLILEIAETDRNFKRFIYKTALYYFLKIFGSIHHTLSDGICMQIIESSEMILKNPGELLIVEGGGFLFKGKLKLNQLISENERMRMSGLQPKEGEPQNPLANLVPPAQAGANSSAGNAQEAKYSLTAPTMLNPMMSGYYKVEEAIIYFSFKNTDMQGDHGMDGKSMRVSIRNNKSMSMAYARRGSQQPRKMVNTKDLEEEYNKLLKEFYPDGDSSKPAVQKQQVAAPEKK